jgi:hypothetical protein
MVHSQLSSRSGSSPIVPLAIRYVFLESWSLGLTICQTCGGGSNILAHMTYSKGEYMRKSAAFVRSQYNKLGGRVREVEHDTLKESMMHVQAF